MEQPKKKKDKKGFLYRMCLIVMPFFYRIFCPLSIRSCGETPEGGFILCCNHFSLNDPFYLAIAHKKRKIHFMAKEELFKNKLLAAAITSLGAFPVSRGNSDRSAIVRAKEIVEEGNVLGIFIEGTRSKTGELQKPKSGAALIAYQTNAPVLPMCITPRGGTTKKLFRRVKISSGKRITPEELGIVSGTSKEIRNAARLIMDRIAELRAEDLADFERRKK